MIQYPILAGSIVTRVYEAGEIGNPAILLVHGLSSRADRWCRNIEGLAQAGYHVIAVDLPGHGLAVKDPNHDHSVPGYAKFVLDLLDALSLGRVVLVGTSFGGHVVATAAIKRPEKVEKLVMIGSTGFAPLAQDRVASLRKWLFHLTVDSHRPYLERVFSDLADVTHKMVMEDVKVNTSPGAKECFERLLNYMENQLNNDLVKDKLLAIQDNIPLLLLWGSEDSSVSIERGREARRHLIKSKLVTIDGLNHTPYYEDPILFNDVLLAFIEDDLKRIRYDNVDIQ